MTGIRKLAGLVVASAALVAALAVAPDNVAIAPAIATLFGAYVAGNREEHRIKASTRGGA